MAEKLGKWSSNRGLISKIRPSDGCKGMPFPWRGNGGTISTNLDVIWGMSVNQVVALIGHPEVNADPLPADAAWPGDPGAAVWRCG